MIDGLHPILEYLSSIVKMICKIPRLREEFLKQNLFPTYNQQKAFLNQKHLALAPKIYKEFILFKIFQYKCILCISF